MAAIRRRLSPIETRLPADVQDDEVLDCAFGPLWFRALTRPDQMKEDFGHDRKGHLRRPQQPAADRTRGRGDVNRTPRRGKADRMTSCPCITSGRTNICVRPQPNLLPARWRHSKHPSCRAGPDSAAPWCMTSALRPSTTTWSNSRPQETFAVAAERWPRLPRRVRPRRGSRPGVLQRFRRSSKRAFTTSVRAPRYGSCSPASSHSSNVGPARVASGPGSSAPVS